MLPAISVGECQCRWIRALRWTFLICAWQGGVTVEPVLYISVFLAPPQSGTVFHMED